MTDMSSRRSLIVFDCDGVLIDSEVIVAKAYADGLSALGYAISCADMIARFTGVPDREMFEIIEAEWGRPVPASFAHTIKPTIEHVYRSELQAIDCIGEALAEITDPVCVASSSAPDKLELGLQLVGLYERFAPNVFSASQVRRGKPAPDLFLFAAATMGYAPAGCLVVEDSVAGVQAARAAGMKVIGFTGGGHCGPGHAERLREEGAAAVIASMRDLPALVQHVMA